MDYTIKGSGHSLSLADVYVESSTNNNKTVRFSASVLSWGFSGSIDFCVDLSSFRDFIAHLKELHDKPRNLAVLRGAFDAQYIRFRPEQLGYTEVNGKLIRYYPRNSVEFEFLIDQTELSQFVQSLYRDFNQHRPS